MVIVLASLVGAIAVLAWIFAVICMFQLIGLAPAGQKVSTLFDLGWWKFSAIEARIGPAAVPVTRNYVRAFLTFFACIVLIAALSILVAMSEQSGAPEQTAIEVVRITDPRIIPVRTAQLPISLIPAVEGLFPSTIANA